MKNKSEKNTTFKLLDEFKKIRKEKGLSHEKLANLAKLDRSTTSFLESHKRIPTILTCLKIAHALGISLSDLQQSIENK